MRRLALPAIPIALAAALVVHPAAAQDPETLGSFKDWAAFSYAEKDAKVCYLVSAPLDTDPKNVRRGDIYVMVTHRPADQVRDEVSVIAGYPYKEKSGVEVTIGGATFKLFTSGENAWMREAKDDSALVRAMIRGTTMIVRGTSARGTRTTDTYSLNGFTAAHDAIDVACNVK